jgi:hypothetical protein
MMAMAKTNGREKMPSSYSAYGLGKPKPKRENPGGNT